MDITPPADDKGLQRLKLEQRNTAIKPVRQTEAFPQIPDERHQQAKTPLPEEDRRHGQRRKGERRQQDLHTPYDTRSGIERRQTLRRSEDREQLHAGLHIDEQA